MVPHKSNWAPEWLFDLSLSFVFGLTGTLSPPLTTTLLCQSSTVLQQSNSSHMGDSISPPTHLCALCTHHLTGHLSRKQTFLRALTKKRSPNSLAWKSRLLANLRGFPPYLIHTPYDARKRSTFPTHALRALSCLCSSSVLYLQCCSPLQILLSAPSTHLQPSAEFITND